MISSGLLVCSFYLKKKFSTDILKNLLVPLPPLSEQRRIVEKHRELLDKITLI